MIELDGSYGEGGGAILRVALAASVLSQKPFRITDIRKNRPNPGLKPQHLHGVNAAQEISSAFVDGCALGSTKLEFVPRQFSPKNLNIDMGTAGSITLLTQSILLPLMFSPRPVRLKLHGGTDVAFSPSMDYFLNVFLPNLAVLAEAKATLIRRGYYPKGGGELELKLKPRYPITDFENTEALRECLRSKHMISLTGPVKPVQIRGVSHASSDLQKNSVAERQARAAKHSLSGLNLPVKTDSEYSDTLSTGSGITVWLQYFDDKSERTLRLGNDALGERSKRAEQVGQEAGEGLAEDFATGAFADRYLADQILPYMAFIGSGKIHAARISGHCLSNIYVLEKFFDVRFKVDSRLNIIEI